MSFLFQINAGRGESEMEEQKIQWHPAFIAAIYLEFKENNKDLVYEKEYNLNTKPLEIDLLVIKKEHDRSIQNEIGKLFRVYNIVEYKSPEDHLNIDSFYKTGAYASLYKAYGENVNSRKADDITVTIIRDRKPVKLFQHFQKNEIKNPYAGIYYIQNHVLFPTQIVVGNELRREEHKWLKLLSPGLEKQEIRNFLESVGELKRKEERAYADAIMEVVTRANWKIIEELRGDEKMCQALLELMEPEINKIVDSAVKSTKDSMKLEMEKENEKSILRAIESYRDLNFDRSLIKELLMKTYELSAQEAEHYLLSKE